VTGAGKRQALGRGLAALIPAAAVPIRKSGRRPSRAAVCARRHREHTTHGKTAGKRFDDGRLSELRVHPQPGHHSTAGGARATGRRLRTGRGRATLASAQRAGLHQVPVIIREVAEAQASRWRWSRTCNAKISTHRRSRGLPTSGGGIRYTRSRWPRAWAGNAAQWPTLSVCSTAALVRAMVVEGAYPWPCACSARSRGRRGHRTTGAPDGQPWAFRRQVEALVRREREDTHRPAPPPQEKESPAARDLALACSAPSQRGQAGRGRPGRGHVEIHYGSLDQLDGIVTKILGS